MIKFNINIVKKKYFGREGIYSDKVYTEKNCNHS